MIEKYFRPGIRFKWTKPRDAIHPAGTPRVYTMVDSREAPNALVYDGLDGQLKDPLLTSVVHVSTLGLTMRMPIPHDWLDYAPSRTARLQLGRHDVLTGWMSGCILASWSQGGNTYVGHIGTIDNQPAINTGVKTAFAAAMGRDTTGFSPSNSWTDQEIDALQRQINPRPEAKIVGLITTRGTFHSIVMFKLQGAIDEWCVGGVKDGVVMDHATLTRFLQT